MSKYYSRLKVKSSILRAFSRKRSTCRLHYPEFTVDVPVFETLNHPGLPGHLGPVGDAGEEVLRVR